MGKHKKPPEGPKGPDEVDYDVGYRKTPVETRFQKGQSGNPGGRPKAAPNTRTSLARVLGRELTVHTADGPETMATTDVLLTMLAKLGAQGKVAATKQLFDMARAHDVGLEQPEGDLTPQDEADFQYLVQALRGK